MTLPFCQQKYVGVRNMYAALCGAIWRYSSHSTHAVELPWSAAGSKVMHTLVHVAVDLQSSAFGKSMHPQGCATSTAGYR